MTTTTEPMTDPSPVTTIEHRRPIAWGPVALAVVAVAFGLTLRWWHLGAKSLWFDEGYTAWVVSQPPAGVVRVIRVDTAPPLYYLILRGWVAVAGTGEAALRAPSAAFATVALGVAVGVICRLFRDPWARAVAVSAVACSFMQVAYAHEVRFYALIGLLGVVDLYVVIRACDGDRPAWGWVAAGAGCWGTSLWLNNIMIFYLACLALAWLVLPGRRPVVGRVVDAAVVAVLAGVIYAPWVPTMLAQARAVQTNFWSHAPALGDLPKMVGVVGGVNRAGEAVGGVWVFPAVAALVVAVSVRRWRTVAGLAVYGLLPLAVTFAYSRHGKSIFIDRAFIVSSLVVPMLLGVPLEVGGRRWRWAGGVGAGLLLAVSVRSAIADRYRVPDHVEDWRGACLYAARPDPGYPAGHRVTVFNANEGEMLYDYYARGGDFSPRADLTGTPGDYFDLRPPRTLQRVRTDDDLRPFRDLLARRPGDEVVFVAAHAPFADNRQRTLALLEGARREVDRREFDAVTVYRFVPKIP